MANNSEKNDLGYLGQEFQYKLIHTFMEDKTFFRDLHSVVDQNMFTDPNLKTYVGVMKEYYESTETVPSYTMMEISLNEKSHNDTQREFFHEVIKKIQETPSDGVDYIRELSERFFRQQNIIKTANEILKIAGNGDTSKYEKCVDLLNEALNKGTHEELGSTVMDNVNETLSDDYRTPIPTGVGKIDETLEGGLGKGELGVIVGPTSFGKAIPNDRMVMTPSGPTPMGEIHLGDYVLGRNGQPTKVIGVYPHKDLEFYNVEFSDNVSCECCKEHLWAVNSINQRTKKTYTNERLSNGKIKKIYNPDLSYKTMSLEQIMNVGLFKRNGKKHNFKIPMPTAANFNPIDVTINPYLIGAMLGDGCFIRHELTIGIEDIDFARNNNFLQQYSYNESIVHKESTFAFKYHKDFKGELSKYYDLTLKSHNKFIHHDYLYNSIENRILLLNGLMDTDGTVKANGSGRYNTKSLQLANDVRTLVLSLGGYARIKSCKSGYFNTKYNEYRDCGLNYSVTISFSDESIKLFKMSRKQDKIRYRNKYKEDRYFHNVEYSRTCDGQCIQVEAEDELYLIDDFIVTHNTSLTTAMASHAATYKCPNNNNQGYKVLQIVFEDRIKQIQRKHIGRITGVEAKDLSKQENVDMVREQLAKFADRELLQNNLRIVRFPSGEITASYLKRFIKKLINNGFTPDMVVADYFECFASESTTANEYSDEGRTMRKLEAMAGELDIALWVPSQGTKDSINAELVTMDKMGGSVKKAQIAHVIMSIARTVEDIERNLATIAILKNRAGKSGKVFNNVEFNNGTCRISTDHVDEFDSMVKFNENKVKDQLILQQKIFRDTKKNI